jgi:hypothetical protein
VTGPLDETQPGLGPVKRRFNKKVLVAAILAGALAAGTQLFPEYASVFNAIGQWVSGAGSQ